MCAIFVIGIVKTDRIRTKHVTSSIFLTKKQWSLVFYNN